MATDTLEAKQLAHNLIDQLGPAQIKAVVGLLEVMVDDDDDELTEEDQRAIVASREYFGRGGEGLSLEQIAADSGLTMDQIRTR